jgi:hypothetical protein
VKLSRQTLGMFYSKIFSVLWRSSPEIYWGTCWARSIRVKYRDRCLIYHPSLSTVYTDGCYARDVNIFTLKEIVHFVKLSNESQIVLKTVFIVVSFYSCYARDVNIFSLKENVHFVKLSDESQIVLKTVFIVVSFYSCYARNVNIFSLKEIVHFVKLSDESQIALKTVFIVVIKINYKNGFK